MSGGEDGEVFSNQLGGRGQLGGRSQNDGGAGTGASRATSR